MKRIFAPSKMPLRTPASSTRFFWFAMRNPGVNERTRDEASGKEGGENTSHQRRSKPANRAAANIEKDGSNDEQRQIRIGNGGSRPGEAVAQCIDEEMRLFSSSRTRS